MGTYLLQSVSVCFHISHISFLEPYDPRQQPHLLPHRLEIDLMSLSDRMVDFDGTLGDTYKQ